MQQLKLPLHQGDAIHNATAYLTYVLKVTADDDFSPRVFHPLITGRSYPHYARAAFKQNPIRPNAFYNQRISPRLCSLSDQKKQKMYTSGVDNLPQSPSVPVLPKKSLPSTKVLLERPPPSVKPKWTSSRKNIQLKCQAQSKLSTPRSAGWVTHHL